MIADGAHFDALAADLDQAVGAMSAQFDRDPTLWSRGRPGKWTAGQHADHLALCLADTADAFERRRAELRAGTLGPVPRRGILHRLWVGLVIGRGCLPRGGRTPRRLEAGPGPERPATLARLARGVARHRALGAGLSAEERDRLWAPNPFLPRWHYTLPEIVRMHAVHVRHHARLIAEIAAAG